MVEKLTSHDILTNKQLESCFKVYAGPGAGKTHFLVENVKNIVTTHELITKSRSRKVVCITYTNAAVDEIKRRLLDYSDYVETNTIHGFIIENIIAPFQGTLLDVMKLDFGLMLRGKGIISSQIEGVGILHGVDREDIYRYIKTYDNGRFEYDTIDYSKKLMGEVQINNDIFIDAVLKKTAYRAALSFSSKIKADHAIVIKKYIWETVRKLTHNEILYFGYRILQINSAALYAIRVKYPFIFVDEFQDTNPLQTLLLKLIGEKSTRIGVVGDIAQSIYSFQGAKPNDFKTFNVHHDSDKAYSIDGNRRSTENIINFSNFLRQSDRMIQQTSVKEYPDEESRRITEAKPIHFLMGDSPAVKDIIATIVSAGGVVLTRSWAAAFNYIHGVSDSQAKLLSKIYNSYHASSIQIREEITTQNNVTWVRAFRFIFGLYNSYSSGSLIDMIKAIKTVTEIDVKLLTPELLFEFDKLANLVFSTVKPNSKTTTVITLFNDAINTDAFIGIRKLLNAEKSFAVSIFDEQEDTERIDAISQLEWDTSYKLFSEVFAENSRYMTVHQAKGQEWDSVVVSLSPTRYDHITLSKVFTNPKIVEENSSDEFVRMFYVACSRAIQDLYVHIISGCTSQEIEKSLASFISKTGLSISYEFIS